MTHPVRPSADVADPGAASSWLRNLQRGGGGGGFWADAAWYDAHLTQRMPQYSEMVRRLVLSLPPLEAGARALDWLGGSGLVAAAVAQAYPEASYAVLDSDARRLDRARARFQQAALPPPTLLEHSATQQQPLPSSDASGYSLVTACLALHHLTEHSSSTLAERETQFLGWSRSLLRVLQPGGHLFAGDHTGQLRLAVQLRLLSEAGFVDVDVAWRVDDMFVIGCRRPVSGATTSEASALAVASPVASPAEAGAPATAVSPAPSAASASVQPDAAVLPATVSDVPTRAAPVAAEAAVAPASAASSTAAAVSTPASGHPQRQSSIDDDEINAMIAALQAQNEELKARLAAAPAAAQQPAPTTEESSAVSAPAGSSVPDAASSSSSGGGGPSPALLSKLPALFSRFDPSRSGQLTYAALQLLCRAVGRVVDDGEDSLWWTYQSIAQADPETGNIGISIEDLTQHFYKAPGMWNLADDLHKLGIV